MANEGGSQKSKIVAGMIVGMVIGVAMASFVAWYVVEKNPASFSKAEHLEPPKPAPQILPPVVAPTSAPVAASGVDETQHYEFYKVLPDKPEGGVAHKQPVTKPPVAKPQPSANPAISKQPAKATDNALYFVQAGAFQNVDEAEKLKAKLALTGMEANVQKADVPGKGVWYRVRLGPYKGQIEANSAVANLKQNGISNVAVQHAQ